MMTSLISVALGGALGASARFLTNVAFMRLFGAGFPWGTAFVNVLGSFLMGILVVALADKDGSKFAPFLLTGFLGGFTTFSAFSLDTMKLVERGEIAFASVYVVGSVAISILGLAMGMALAKGALS